MAEDNRLLVLELYRTFCGAFAGLLFYQCILIAITERERLSSRSRNVVALCATSGLYALSCWLGTWPQELLGFDSSSWALGPLLGCLSFYFYVRVMCAELQLVPRDIHVLRGFLLMTVALLMLSWADKVFWSTETLYRVIPNNSDNIYRIQGGETRITNTLLTKCALALVGIFCLRYSWLFLRAARKQGNTTLCTGIAANFLIVVNDVLFATRPSAFHVPLSFCAYFIEAAYLTITLMRQSHAHTREVEGELIEAGKAAELGAMAAQICHDIRNPLAIIDAIARQLSREFKSGPNLLQATRAADEQASQLDPLSRDQAEKRSVPYRLQRITLAVDRIQNITADYLGVMRAETHADPTPQPLLVLVQRARDLCEAKLTRCRVDRFNIDIPDNLNVLAHENRVVMAFVNLISNSADALAGQSERWISVSARDLKRHIEIRFTDAGRGIPEEIRNRLFTTVFSTKAKGTGTGLGLRFSRKVCESHGGSLWIDGGAPHTTFVVTLPHAAAEQPTPETPWEGAA